MKIPGSSRPTEPMTLERLKQMHFDGWHGNDARTAKRMLQAIHSHGFATQEAKDWALARSKEDFEYPLH
jgi:hypothetical protein